MKKVIVTGAAGFVGRHLVAKLQENGVEVIALVRAERSAKLGDRMIVCEMSDYASLPELIEDRDIDTVFHLAWQGVSDAHSRDEDVQLRNIKASLDLVDAAAKMGITTLIGAGSLHEAEAITQMGEDSVITNLGYMYKAAKTCAHFMAKAKAGNRGLRFFWPIITNTYGEGEHSARLINTVIRDILAGHSPALSEGKQLYDFVHISDVAQAFYLIGEKGVDGTNYIIGSGEAKPLRDFLSRAGDIAGNVKGGDAVPLQFGAIKSNVVFLGADSFNTSTLMRDTGFVPMVSFDEGIYRTAQWLKEQAEIVHH